MFNFEDAKKLDIALAAERYSIKWRPIKKSFMFSKGTFDKLNLENNSIDLVFLSGEIFLAVQPGNDGHCMKARSGSKKSRNMTPATYAEKLHDSLIEKGWTAGAKLDVEDQGLVETGELKGCHMWLVVNKDAGATPNQAAAEESAEPEAEPFPDESMEHEDADSPQPEEEETF